WRSNPCDWLPRHSPADRRGPQVRRFELRADSQRTSCRQGPVTRQAGDTKRQARPVRLGHGEVFAEADRVGLEMIKALVIVLAERIRKGPAPALAEQIAGLVLFARPGSPNRGERRLPRKR